MQPEDKNSGRKLTSQSTQSLTMPSPVSTSPVQISFTPQWHPMHNIQYNETQPIPINEFWLVFFYDKSFYYATNTIHDAVPKYTFYKFK